MNRRDFFRIAGWGLLGTLFPGVAKEGLDYMPIGDMLLKLAEGKPLSSGEKDSLRLWGNRTEMANAYVAGLDTAGVSPNVDGLNARRLEVRDRMLIGSALSGKSNLYYDSATGALQFRTGTTVNSYIDSSGEFFPFALLYSNTLTQSAASLASASIPTTYPNLLIIGSARTDLAGAEWENVRLRFNGDSGANYDTGYQGESDGASAPGQSLGLDSAIIGLAAAADAPAGSAGGFWAFTTNVNSALWKSVFGVTGARGTIIETAQWTFHTSWKSTALVASISIHASGGGNFVAGSHVSVYGMR